MLVTRRTLGAPRRPTSRSDGTRPARVDDTTTSRRVCGAKGQSTRQPGCDICVRRCYQYSRSWSRPRVLLPLPTTIIWAQLIPRVSLESWSLSIRRDSSETTMVGLRSPIELKQANCRVWGVLAQCTFPETQQLVIARQASCESYHQTRHWVSFAPCIGPEEIYCAPIQSRNALDLRAALTAFAEAQSLLSSIDSVDHSYSEEDARKFVLRALRKQRVGFLDVCRRARTPGDTSFATFEQTNVLLDTRLPRPNDDAQLTTSNILLTSAAAVEPATRGSTSRRTRSSEQTLQRQFHCIRCERGFTTRSVVNRAQLESARSRSRVPTQIRRPDARARPSSTRMPLEYKPAMRVVRVVLVMHRTARWATMCDGSEDTPPTSNRTSPLLLGLTQIRRPMRRYSSHGRHRTTGVRPRQHGRAPPGREPGSAR